MRNLNLLDIDNEVRELIQVSSDKLRAYAGIAVDILEVNEKTIRIHVEQKELKNNYILNQKQLVSRAGALFTPLERKFKLYFVPVIYVPPLNQVTQEWINERMQELGLSRNDIIKQVGIDKATLSEMLSGEKALTKFHKATFYYYFLTYELNRDFREYQNE
ncbi:hypothetical protein [Adhaeribacter aquaticus]|uniref:hypothetical protein n=1 Tax=Adhaeribacter aquaticus TaxID=299567 RepID=UPI00040240C0|nr:hypothetical protein [Adhaeribacter aquaticus]